MKDVFLKRAEIMAYAFCNKIVEYNSEARFHHEVDSIVVSSCYTEVVHEIAHYLVADPSKQGEYNLGLPLPEDDGDIDEKSEIGKRLFFEECAALHLTKLLFDEYFSDVSPDSKEYSYISYLYGEVVPLGEKTGVDVDKAVKHAEEVFKTIV